VRSAAAVWSFLFKVTRIKMNIMMKPVTGKEFFELMSLTISAVNGCEMCVNAHEK
jgi:lipoyl-dependent peroxiredoxin subunit D